jgi:Bacterial regulatory proteins, tetR family.
MNPLNPASESEEIRRRILDAAEARFRVYGYRKTTMAEIAEDTDMSAAILSLFRGQAGHRRGLC